MNQHWTEPRLPTTRLWGLKHGSPYCIVRDPLLAILFPALASERQLVACNHGPAALPAKTSPTQAQRGRWQRHRPFAAASQALLAAAPHLVTTVIDGTGAASRPARHPIRVRNCAKIS